MPHETELLLTLAGGLGAALVLGLLAVRLRLSPIVGYVVAGIVVGPFTPGFVAHAGLASQLAEVGVILLMFGVGLQFHVEELLAVRRIALPGAVAAMAAATGAGALASHFLGASVVSSVVFGLSICISSTVVLVRVLADHDALHTQVGHTAVGWLVVEDVAAVLVLVLLPLALGGEGGGGGAAFAIALAKALGKVALLVGLVLVLGRRLVPAVLLAVAKTRARDVFTLSVLAIALGVAVGSAKLFGVSLALGAFLAGLVVGQSPFGARAASEAIPMKDAFAVLFFVSVGMQLDPKQIGQSVGPALVTLLVAGVVKPLTAFVTVRALGLPRRTAAPLAATLAQVGEFSFILASVGRSLGALSDASAQGIILASVVMIALNPFLYRVSRGATDPAGATGPEHGLDGPSAVVIGYGPVGRTLSRLLRENGVTPVVVELNHELTAEATKAGLRAVNGDASQRHTLEVAGVAKARTVIFAASGSPPLPVVQMAKDLNPNVRVIARAPYVRDSATVRSAGADVVVVSEAEVALAMTERLLADLGATPEQLDRARDRVRSELG